jgi:hypothetical protein
MLFVTSFCVAASLNLMGGLEVGSDSITSLVQKVER